MNDLHSPALAFLLLALPVSLLLTLAMIGLARQRDWVARPKEDRWHTKPTALYGGVAIFGTFALGCLPWLAWMVSAARWDLLGLLLGAVTIFAVGLRDDIRPLNPLVKLLGQVMAVTPYLVGLLLTHHATVFTLSLPLIVLWMTLLTNSFNLLDNMDGLSAGTALWTSAMLMLLGLVTQQLPIAILSALCAAACWGFLVFNFRWHGSAKIFMGDCGSMFLGFLLAGLTVLAVGTGAKSPATIVCLPLLLMAVPLFDTILVIVIRRRENRAISQGGRDHSSHRLVYAGFSERIAVLALNSLTFLCGLVGVGLASSGNSAYLPAAALAAVGILVRLGLYLNGFPHPRPVAASVSAPAPAPQKTNPAASEPISLSSRESQIDTKATVAQK